MVSLKPERLAKSSIDLVHMKVEEVIQRQHSSALHRLQASMLDDAQLSQALKVGNGKAF